MPASANTKQSVATRANPIYIDTIQQEPIYQPKDLLSNWVQSPDPRQTGYAAKPLKTVWCMNF